MLTARHCCAWTLNMTTSVGRQKSRSEEHTSELQSQSNLVCRLLLEQKKIKKPQPYESLAPTTRLRDTSLPPNMNFPATSLPWARILQNTYPWTGVASTVHPY